MKTIKDLLRKYDVIYNRNTSPENTADTASVTLHGDYGFSPETQYDYYQQELSKREQATLDAEPVEVEDESDKLSWLGRVKARLTNLAIATATGQFSPFNGYEIPGAVTDMVRSDNNYTGANGRKTNWATQAKNINVHDALAINIQSRLTEFMNSEGSWVPEMEIAREYLDQKLLLSQLSPDTEGYDSVVQNVEELGEQVKKLARTNPYLREIFYGEPTMAPFTLYPGQINPQKVKQETVNSALEKGRWQDRELIDASWNQTNNELSDKNTAQAKLQVKIDKLTNNLNEAQEIYDDKQNEIKEKQKALKTPHELHLLGVNTHIWYNPEDIDPAFDKYRQEAEISLLKPSTYKYGLTHLGSSLSEAQMMGLSYASAAAAKYGTKLFKHPLAWAASEMTANLWFTKYLREKETAAEVLSAYSEKLLQNADKFDIEQVMKDYEEGLQLRGYDISKMEDLEKLQFGVALNIPTADQKYNEFARDARVGLTQLEQENNALALNDYLENFGLSYGSTLLKTGIGSEIKAATKKGFTSLVSRNAKIQQGLKELRSRLGRTADKVLKNPMQKVATRRALDAIGRFSYETAKRAVLEGIEEGQQGVFQRRYLDKPVEHGEIEQPYSFFQGVVQSGTASAESILAYYGLHWNDLYNTDQQIVHAMDIGAFIGGIMGSGGNAITTANRTRKQIKSDLSLQKLAAEGGARAETSFKVAQFLDSYRKGNNTERLVNSIEAMKKYKGEGVTDKMIDDDIDIARLVGSIYKNKAIKPNLEKLNIDRKHGDDFEMFVQNQVQLINSLKENDEEFKEAQSDISKKIEELFDPELKNPFNLLIQEQYDKYVKEFYSKPRENLEEQPVDIATFRAPVINALVTRATDRVLDKLLKDIGNRKTTLEQIQKEYGINVSTAALVGLQEYLKQAKKDSSETLKKIDKEMFEGTLDTIDDPSDTDELEKLLASSLLIQGIGSIIATKAQAYTTGRIPVKNRYLVERMPLFSTLDEEQQNKVLTEYAEKYKADHNTTKEPTRKQVIAYYNMLTQRNWYDLENNANVEENERNLANMVILQDLLNSRKSRQQGQQENREQLGAETEENQDNETQPTTSPAEPVQQQPPVTQPPTTEPPAAEPPSTEPPVGPAVTPTPTVAPPDGVTTTEPQITPDEASDESQPKQGEGEPDEISVDEEPSAAETETPQDEGVDIDAFLGGVLDEEYSGNQKKRTRDKDVKEDEESKNQEATLQHIDEDAVEEDELRVKLDGLQEGEPIATVPEVIIGGQDEQASQQEASPQEDTEPVSEPAQVSEQPQATAPANPVATVKTPAKPTKTVTLHPTSYDGTTDEEVVIPVGDGAEVIYSDEDGNTWVGDEDIANGQPLSEEEIHQDQTFNEWEYGKEAKSSADDDAEALQYDKQPGVDSKKKAETNGRIRRTFFYAYEATKPMDIAVIGSNGKTTQVFFGKNVERQPGAALAKKLAIPGWLAKQRAYYIVTDNNEDAFRLHKNQGGDLADYLAVHLVIEETTDDGKTLVYNLALKTPTDARDKMVRVWQMKPGDVTEELGKLRELRRSIISKYLDKYAPNYIGNPNESLPSDVSNCKGVVPVDLRCSNGSINSQKDENDKPVYQPITKVKTLGLSDDPIEMGKQITEGTVEFGYGKGLFPRDKDERMTLVHFDGTTQAVDSEGNSFRVGYAGKVFIIPRVEDTPSGKTRVPIMLSEKRHFIEGGARNFTTNKLSFDSKGNARYDEKGKRVPINSAELVFRLVTNTLPTYSQQQIEQHKAALNILVNSGASTITLGDDRVQRLQFYLRKTLHSFTSEKDGCQYLMYAKRQDGRYILKYLKIRNRSGNVVFTDQQAVEVIQQISNNLHWNTDKKAMVAPIADAIVDHAIEYMRANNTDKLYLCDCKDLEFTAKDLNLKVERDSSGKITNVTRDGETPILMTWMINHQILKTDLGDMPFKAPFVYANGAAVSEQSETQPAQSQPQQPSQKMHWITSYEQDDLYLAVNTSQGMNRLGDIKVWSRRTVDLRGLVGRGEKPNEEHWGKYNGLYYYYKPYKSGRGGDNFTIWFRFKPTQEVKDAVDEVLKSDSFDYDKITAAIKNSVKTQTKESEAPAKPQPQAQPEQQLPDVQNQPAYELWMPTESIGGFRTRFFYPENSWLPNNSAYLDIRQHVNGRNPGWSYMDYKGTRLYFYYTPMPVTEKNARLGDVQLVWFRFEPTDSVKRLVESIYNGHRPNDVELALITEAVKNSMKQSASQQPQTQQPEQEKTEGQLSIVKILTNDEANAAGKTPKRGFVVVQLSDGRISQLSKSSEKLKEFQNKSANGVHSTVRGTGQINVEQAKQWLHDTLGIDPDDVMVTNAVMKAINAPQVYGLLQSVFDRIHDEFRARITLSTQSGEGVEYHEAWHYVSLLLLDSKTRDQIYSDYVKRNPQYKNYTKEQVEEQLAEEFRSFMLNETNPTLGYRVKKFFRSVWHLISKLAGRRLDLQHEVFNAIRKGNFKNAQLDQETLEEFNKAYQEGIGYYAPGVSDKDQAKVPHITNANTWYNVVETLSSTALAILDIKSMEDIQNLKLDDVFNSIQAAYDIGEYNSDQNKKALIKDVLDNKGLFAKQIREYLSELGIRAVKREEAEIAEKEGKDVGDKADNIWDRASYEISKKANISFNAKLFFYSIPRAKFVLDENGEQVVTTIKDNIFGLDIVQPFDITWNQILENLWNVNDWDDLVNRVNNLARTIPFFAVLRDRISDPDYPLPENTVTQLLTTIQSAKNSMDTVQISTEQGRVWSVLDSDNLRKIRRLPSQWSQNFMLSAFITSDANNKSKIDKSIVARMNNFVNNINGQIKGIKDYFDGKNTDSSLESVQEQFITLKNNILRLLNGIGIPFDMECLDYLLRNIELSTDANLTQLQHDFQALLEIYGTPVKAGKNNTRKSGGLEGTISDMIWDISSISRANNLEVKRKGAIKISAPRIFNRQSAKAVINLMALAYGKVHPSPEEFSVSGADGHLMYPITQNNYMSDQLRWLNTNRFGKLDNLARASYSKNSLIVKALRGNQKPTLKLHTLIAINDVASNTSRKYFQISPLEDYLTKLTLVHSDRLVLPTMSDKPTWYSIEGLKLPKDILSSLSGYRFSDATLDIFINYFIDEYNAIVDYFDNKKEVEKSRARYYDNYHGKLDANGKMQPGGNGGRFRYFNMVPKGVSLKWTSLKGVSLKWASLNSILDVAEKSGDDNLVKEFLSQLKTRLIDNRKLFRVVMNDLLIDRVNTEIKQAIELGVIGRDKNTGLLTWGNLPSLNSEAFKFYNSNTLVYPADKENVRISDTIYSIIANYVTGYAISIEEVEKCFTGDPAFYKWKTNSEGKIYQRDVDKIKRLSSVLSTGDNLRINWGQGDPRNDTKFVTAVMKDNMIFSDYYDRLKQLFKADVTRTMLKKNNPTLTDDQLFELTSDNNIETTLNDRNKLSEQDVKFIEKSAENAANPYGRNSKDGTGNINQADAAVYIRPAMYKRIMQSLGEWSPEIERAYDLLENNDKALSDPDVYKLIATALIKPLKMVYFGDHFDPVTKTNIPVFDKMAIFPMFKILATGDNRLLYDRMNNEELGVIDMLAFESAVKVGSTQDKLQVYNNAENTSVNVAGINSRSSITVNDGVVIDHTQEGGQYITTTVQDMKQLRLQLNTDPHTSTERSFGTQAVKICLGNVVDDRHYGSNKGVDVTGNQIKKDVFGCIKALSNIGFDDMRKRFFNRDSSINNRALSQFLIDEARSNNMSAEIINALKLDKNGNFKAPVASLSIRNWVESRVLSLIGRKVVDVNTPGGSAIQMASFGFKSNNIIPEKNVRAFNGGNKLDFSPDKGSMEIMLSINFFRNVVPKEFQKDYVTMRDWLITNNIIGPNAKPYGVGYRIPTQGLSSTFAFVVADVLPSQLGDVAVVPDEFTAMTGSDFDVDKLFLATYAYDPETHERYAYDESKDYEHQSAGALINKLLDSYSLIISDSKTIAETRASIDTLTKTLQKEILPLVQPNITDEAEPMYELLPSFQESRKTEYSSGKTGIAPFALHTTNHCLTQAIHLRMNYSPAAKKYDLGEIDAIDGQDHRRILDWFSAMINAHVDVAKDPYIIALNVNQTTYNMVSFLLRAGKGQSTFLFIAQPVLKEFARLSAMNRGVIGTTKSNEAKILKGLYQKYLNMLQNYETSDNEAKEAALKLVKDGDISAFDQKALTESLEAFRNNTVGLDHIKQQLLVLKAYMDLTNDAQSLSNLVQRSQIDTKKYGNTLSQLQNFYNSYITFINDNKTKFYTKDVSEDGLTVYFDTTFLNQKLSAVMALSNSLLKNQIITATPGFKQIFTQVLQKIQGVTRKNEAPIESSGGKSLLHLYKHVGDKQLINNLSARLESIVRAKAVAENSAFTFSDEELNELLFGTNSIARRLNGIKNYIRQHKDKIELAGLVDEYGNITNVLLDYLQAITMGDKQKINYITTATSSMNNSKNYENMLRSAFYDLLYSADLEVSDFARTLAMYAFFTSYDNRAPNSFFHLVPMEFKRDMHYVGAIQDVLDRFNNGEVLLSNVVATEEQANQILLNLARNYYRDNNIVPAIIDKSNDADHYTNIHQLGMAKDKRGKMVRCAFTVSDKPQIQSDYKFCKLVAPDGSMTLYQRAGYIVDEEGNTKEIVYVLVPKLGFDAGTRSVYELYKEGNQLSAFDINNPTPDMLAYIANFQNYQTEPGISAEKRTAIDTRIINIKSIKANASHDYTYEPDTTYKVIDYTGYSTIDEQVSDFVNVSINENDVIVSTPEEVQAELTSGPTETDNGISIDDQSQDDGNVNADGQAQDDGSVNAEEQSPDDNSVDAEDMAPDDDNLDFDESSDDVIDETGTNLEGWQELEAEMSGSLSDTGNVDVTDFFETSQDVHMSELTELGKQRKEECK